MSEKLILILEFTIHMGNQSVVEQCQFTESCFINELFVGFLQID